MTDPETQHARWRRAVELLGGTRSAARAIGLSERSVHRLLHRESMLHDGHLRDTAAALHARSRECLQLEKLITPAFSSNLTAQQPRETGNRIRHRPRENT